MSFDLDGLDGLLPPPEAPKGRPAVAPIRAVPISLAPAQPVARVAVGRPEATPAPDPAPFEEEAPTSVREPVASPPPVVLTPPPAPPAPRASGPWLGVLAAAGVLGVVVIGGVALLARSPVAPGEPTPTPPVVTEAAPPVVTEAAPPVVTEAAPPVVAEAPPAPPVVAEAPPAPPVVAEAPPAPPATLPTAERWTIPFTLRDAEPGALELPAWVAACPSLHVVGHTCDLGEPDANLALGLARANAVRTRLVQAGVPADHLVVDSAGGARPMIPNTTSTARAKNRRVEVTCAAVR